MEHTALNSSFRFKIRLVCLICLSTDSLDLEPDVINMQTNTQEDDITVSCVT